MDNMMHSASIRMAARTHRVKSIDLHDTEPLAACGHITGRVTLCNYKTQTLVGTFDVGSMSEPCRCVKFIHSLNYIACGSDDCNVHIFDISTRERVATFWAHDDYVRSIAVVEEHNLLLTSGDDNLIKAWDWTRGWGVCMGVFKGHTNIIMNVAFHLNNNGGGGIALASASLDNNVRLWNFQIPTDKSPTKASSLSSTHAAVTAADGATATTITSSLILKGHTEGVCGVDFHPLGTTLASGSDDQTVRIWDVETGNCIQILGRLHTAPLSAVGFHPALSMLYTVSEDSTVGVYSCNTTTANDTPTTWVHTRTLRYKLNRGWAVGFKKRGSIDNTKKTMKHDVYNESPSTTKTTNDDESYFCDNESSSIVALGFDDGFVIISPRSTSHDDEDGDEGGVHDGEDDTRPLIITSSSRVHTGMIPSSSSEDAVYQRGVAPSIPSLHQRPGVTMVSFTFETAPRPLQYAPIDDRCIKHVGFRVAVLLLVALLLVVVIFWKINGVPLGVSRFLDTCGMAWKRANGMTTTTSRKPRV